MELLAIKEAIAGLAGPVRDIIDDLHTSKVEKAEAMAKLQSVLNQANIEVERIGMVGIEAEAKSESWIARNWRPIASLIFISIVPAIIIGSFVTVGGVVVSTTIAAALATVPGIVWAMIGGCFSGYAALRSLVDKPLKAGVYNELSAGLNNKKAQRKSDKMKAKLLKKGFSAEEIGEVFGDD